MKMIWLTQGQFTLVDDSDYDWLNQWKWYAAKRNNIFYAGRNEGGIHMHMHREILRLTVPSFFADHEDGNGLNNQRSNLRIATRRENNCNRKSRKNSTSKYLGVCWHKQNKSWNAKIRKNGVVKSLGYFKNEIDAAMVYNISAKELHGEFAKLNII